jgi:hypothetical protein
MEELFPDESFVKNWDLLKELNKMRNCVSHNLGEGIPFGNIIPWFVKCRFHDDILNADFTLFLDPQFSEMWKGIISMIYSGIYSIVKIKIIVNDDLSIVSDVEELMKSFINSDEGKKLINEFKMQCEKFNIMGDKNE